MATVNFSIPDDVKTEFNQLFDGENKSAVLTGMIRKAIEERKAKHRRLAAMSEILNIRSSQNPVTDSDIQSAKHEIRE